MTAEQKMVLIYGLFLVGALFVLGLSAEQSWAFWVGLIALLGLVVGLGEWMRRG